MVLGEPSEPSEPCMKVEMHEMRKRNAFVCGVALVVFAIGFVCFFFALLRRRSGSLIAPIALHWSLNGLGALAAALVWHLS